MAANICGGLKLERIVALILSFYISFIIAVSIKAELKITNESAAVSLPSQGTLEIPYYFVIYVPIHSSAMKLLRKAALL